MPLDFLVSTLDGESPFETGGEPVLLHGTRGKRCAANLPGLSTAGWSTPLRDEIADFLLEGDALVKVYEVLDQPVVAGRDVRLIVPGEGEQVVPAGETIPAGSRLLRFHGTLLTAVEQGKAGIVVCSAIGPRWIASMRLVGKSTAGYTNGTVLAQVDRGAVVADLLGILNAEQDTGIQLGTVTPSSDTYVGPWLYRPFDQCLADLATGLGAPEYRFVPIEFDQGKIARLDVGPAIGVQRPDAVFSFGRWDRNVEDYTRTVTNEGRANRVFHLPPGFPDTATQGVLDDEDPAGIAERLLEAVVQADLSVDDLRQKLLAYHLQVRKGPRQTIAFQPVNQVTTGRVPLLGIDFDIGDLVPFRSWRQKPDLDWALRIDAYFRAYQLEWVENELGVITPTITVAPDAS